EFVDGYGAHGFVELPALGFPGLEALVDQEGDGRGQNRQAGGDVDTELNLRQIHLQESLFLFHNVTTLNISRFYFVQWARAARACRSASCVRQRRGPWRSAENYHW